MRIHFLEWDSIFFKRKIAEITADEFTDIQKEVFEYDLLYVKQNKDFLFEIDSFEETYAETKVFFVKTINQGNQGNQEIDKHITAPFSINKIEDGIMKLAFESGKFSRFKLDKRFSQSEFEKLYTQWVKNAFLTNSKNSVLVYQDNQKTVGFITFERIENFFKIGLFAVDAEMSRSGIGTKLIRAVEKIASDAMIEKVIIPTQLKNEVACNFYHKLGYTINEKIIIKHLWRNDPI